VTTIAIIPARSGSQRVPGKNTRLLAGHPLLAYSIHAAVASGVCDRVIVSTDSTEIADIATRYGFWHLGRFAKDYRSFFGEYPRETALTTRGRTVQ
jgi:CMP-N-acetylneuraminic acid synthetase